MTNYKQLAFRYLKQNKKRTFLTILGVALSTMILFVFFNCIISFYMMQRDACREQVKYEVVFWCENKEMAEQLMKEKYIRTFERMSLMRPEGGAICDNALCVNFEHPYQMNVYLERAVEKYGVTYDYTELAAYYFTAGEDNLLLIVVLTVLLFAYIFAIFSVAVVRNSIQLITLEQMKDYGVLRCIGSTKEQLKRMVYLMGFVLEMSGMVLGIGLGFLLYLGIAVRAKLEIGFHVISIPFILMAFWGDLYFVMQENCRFVNRMTPVAAVRGEFKINQRALRAHRKSMLGFLLGIEGDYAVKNLKRNPTRMWKSICAMAMGIAMVVATVSVCSAILNYETMDSKRYGRYQIVNATPWKPGIHNQQNEERMLPAEWKEQFTESEQVVAEKTVYEVVLYTANPLLLQEHFTDSFKTETFAGRGMENIAEKYRKEDVKEELKKIYETELAANNLVAYDEEDYRRLEKELVAGTLDISEKGIVLVNGIYTLKADDKMLNEVWEEFVLTDFQVGDSVEFVDFEALDLLMREKMAGDDRYEAFAPESFVQINNLISDCCKELIEAGKTKIYIIEGIVEKDVNRPLTFEKVRFVLPLERYFEETGLIMEQSSGTMYRMEGYRLEKELKELYISGLEYITDISYMAELEFLGSAWDVIVGVAIFVLFLVIINLLNISNTTASDLYLRRKEFAQLRVLGMSKKRLIYTVMLEGAVIALGADVLGVTLGYGIVKCAIGIINMNYYVPLTFSWSACILMLVVNTVVICLTVYLPIRGMSMNMVEELQAAGE